MIPASHEPSDSPLSAQWINPPSERGRDRISTSYRLMVQQVGKACFFQLSWGTSQQLSAALPYPNELTNAYDVWRHNYIGLYRQPDFNKSAAQAPQSNGTKQSSPTTSSNQSSELTRDSLERSASQSSSDRPQSNPATPTQPTDSPDPPPPLRGRAQGSGRIEPGTTDRHARLAKTEATMLHQFQRWLRSSELYEIRAEIGRAALAAGTQTAKGGSSNSAMVDIWLTCTPLELERLPWEAWEIGEELASSSSIRIARYPLNVRTEPTPIRRRRSSRMRVLAIMGDETGLDFEADRRAVAQLSSVADIEFVGYQPNVQATDLKNQIADAIDDERGWDILFFAGHSTEAAQGDVSGGDLSIAPNTRLSMQDIVPHLKRARQRGLQLAVFNSCCGLSIAQTCIDAGLSQVAIAREPIHNQVAQEFLLRLLHQLAAGEDAHTAVRSVSQWFKLEKNFTYPSAHLLPSFFRHPDTELFRLDTLTLKQRLARLLPDRTQAFAVTGLTLLSILTNVQDVLLHNRTFVQAIYRDVTRQLPVETAPPVMLVQIDRESIVRAGMSNPYPMNREYLASLVDRLSEASFPTIGIDYLLDRPQAGNDSILASSIQNAVQERGAWMVLASISDNYAAASATDVAPLAWTLRGDIYSYPNFLKLPWRGACYEQTCPFAYVMALSYTLSQEPLESDRIVPHPGDDGCLQAQLVNAAYGISAPESATRQLAHLHQSPMTGISSFIGQLWMQPILDFSLPPHQVYDTVPAWQVLSGEVDLSTSSRQIALIAPGGYPESGIESPDYYPVPAAMAYWRNREVNERGWQSSDRNRPPLETENVYTGAEAHAFSIHHLLKRHRIIPVPDVWMVGLAAIFAQWMGLHMLRQKQQSPERSKTLRNLVAGNVVYILLSIQLYVSAAVLLPVVLPTLTLWGLILQSTRRTLRE